MPKKKVNDVKAEIKKIVKKKKRKVYFGQEVQNAVVEYNSSTDDNERNLIYGTRIHAAFDKLAENIINTFKFTYFDMPFEDVKHEVVAFMVMNIHKYDHTKGSKAFSYFSVVAKNYLILNNNANYKKYKSHDSIDAARALASHPVNEDPMIILEESIRYFEDKTPEIFSKHRDRMIAYAIIDLMKARNTIEDFNKKAIYILLREMTNVETSQITKVLNVLRKHMKTLRNNFHMRGSVFPKSNIDKFS